MQGIRNGACDYLVKPVRIQELQNIWQHVVRRNKSITLKRPPPSSIEQVNNEEFNHNNVHDVPCERLKCKILEENSSRGDDMNDDDEQEDSGRENEESTQPKKPRLFWSVELHQKFVDAVNSLGIEKAFPKKILDMMNVEGLTREKVASHLQKYRLYLRKVNDGTDEASSKISAYENGNIGPLGGGYGVFQSLAGTTTRYHGINQSLLHPAMFGRLNTVGGVSIRGLASSPMLQTVQLSNVNSTSTPFPLGNFTPNHNGTIFQGFPSLDENEGAFANQPSSNNGALEGTSTASSNLHDPNRYSSNWETSFQSSGYSQAAQHNLLTPNISGKTLAPPMSQMPNVQNDPLAYLCGFSSITDSKENLQTQDYSNGNNIINLNLLGQSHTSVASSSLIPDVAPVYQNVSQNNSNISTLPLRRLEGSSSQIMQQPNDKQHMKLDDFLLDDSKTIGSSSNGGSEYLEDILGKFLKQDNGETTRATDEFDIDPFSI